jgi:hypothetical protein
VQFDIQDCQENFAPRSASNSLRIERWHRFSSSQ